jgi:ligand-binding sensor domain-containing protein
MTQIKVDNNNVKWIGTFDGLVKFDTSIVDLIDTADGLMSNHISDFDITIDGIYALGSNGLTVINEDTVIRYDTLFLGSPSSSFFSSLLLTGDNIWLGSLRNGLYCVSVSDSSVTRYTADDYLESNVVYDLDRDLNGNIYVCTLSGLTVYNPDSIYWNVREEIITNDTADIDFAVYPNPSTSSFMIEAPISSTIFIYNQKGQLVHQSNGGNQLWEPEISNSVYIVKVQTKNCKKRKTILSIE